MTNFNIENFIEIELDKLLPNHHIKNAYHWAMFPAGKLFRPNLALAITHDLNLTMYQDAILKKNLSLLYFAAALECHHSYSLVHDDLPSMDNDLIRRGKEATHIKFGEWKAILVGDGLINISYEFLSKVKLSDPLRYQLLFKLFSRSLGPKGLIHGQTLDLSKEMTQSFENTLLTHKLKTGRLIQIAILGSALISTNKNIILEKKLWRYGEKIGILFQFLDDLSELSESTLTKHESDVNPWPHYTQEVNQEIIAALKLVNEITKELKLINTQNILKNYFLKMNNDFKKYQKNIEMNVGNSFDLGPIILLLDQFNSI